MESAAPSVPKIRFSKLRIAWSVLAAFACICLIVFWVRSFRITDALIEYRNGRAHQLASARGELIDSAPHEATYSSSTNRSWKYAPRGLPEDWRVPANILGFRFGAPNSSMIPYWFVLLITAGIGIVPWMHWKFSLRTILIAVTAVAVLLGLARLATISN